MLAAVVALGRAAPDRRGCGAPVCLSGPTPVFTLRCGCGRLRLRVCRAGTQPFSNPLLVRTELAKVKPTTYDLPGQGHTFGKALERDAEDAGAGAPVFPLSCEQRSLRRLSQRALTRVRARAVTMSWKEHVKNPHKVGVLLGR